MAKPTPSKNPVAIRLSKRARAIIEMMLKEMREGMNDENRATMIRWVQMFGSEQSMISSLRKLLHVLAALPEEGASIDTVEKDAAPLPMTAEEVAMLKGWLEER